MVIILLLLFLYVPEGALEYYILALIENYMFINLEPNYALVKPRQLHPCPYYIFAIKLNRTRLFFFFNGKPCYKKSTEYWGEGV